MTSDILQRSFNEQKTKIKPLCNEFKETLKEHIITNEDIEKNLSCSICQDSFKEGEQTIILPCGDEKHFFHKQNTDECNGIFPWFLENNTCPMC